MHCNLDIMCSLCVIKHCALKRHNHKLLGIECIITAVMIHEMMQQIIMVFIWHYACIIIHYEYPYNALKISLQYFV